ncbi:MAG: hypothetical protein UIJ87_02780 [Anaerovoracaceae bacterium]|nr:hypothetical protein [Anaerovoracaceae bacterium]
MESIFCKKAHRSGYGALKNKLGRLADSDYEKEIIESLNNVKQSRRIEY